MSTQTQTTHTIGQKITQTLKRFAVGFPLLIGIFAISRPFIGGMAAAAVALILMSIIVNVYFATPDEN